MFVQLVWHIPSAWCDAWSVNTVRRVKMVNGILYAATAGNNSNTASPFATSYVLVVTGFVRVCSTDTSNSFTLSLTHTPHKIIPLTKHYSHYMYNFCCAIISFFRSILYPLLTSLAPQFRAIVSVPYSLRSGSHAEK